MTSIRILAVDDFQIWQDFLKEIFASERDFELLTFVGDGLEAVQKAAELRPDVILMDLSLPGINGLEATRRIRSVSPNSKVLFLSEHHGHDLVAAAFEAGASGYVLKSDSNSDLVVGIRGILEYRPFVSRSLRGDSGCSSGTL